MVVVVVVVCVVCMCVCMCVCVGCICVCMDVYVGFSPSILSRIPPLSLPNGHYILPSITFSFPLKDFLIFNPSNPWFNCTIVWSIRVYLV